MTRTERDEITSALRVARALLRPRGRVFVSQEEVKQAVTFLDAIDLGPARIFARALEGQIPLRLPLHPETPVEGCPLHVAGMTAAQCCARQEEGDRHSDPGDADMPYEIARHKRKRGRDYQGGCRTEDCGVGRLMRSAMGWTPGAASNGVRERKRPWKR